MKRITDIVTFGDILNGGENLVFDISDNSKTVKEGTLYFAIRGTKTDGHDYVFEAIKNKACGVVVEDIHLAVKLKESYKNLGVVLTQNTRKSLSLAANRFFDEPSKDMKIIGITGTNGKTSVSNILSQFYEYAGNKVGVIGTINYRIGSEVISSGHTTPDPINWFKTLKTFREKKADVVVCEISSHALDQYRVYGTNFAGAIYTNLTQDHLDYHKDMEDYFNAKEKLFYLLLEFGKNPKASINYDDEYGKRIYQKFKDKIDMISYGKSSDDFRIRNISLSMDHTKFKYTYKNIEREITTNLLGEFNVYNLSACLSYLIIDGFDHDFLTEKSKVLRPIKGRFDVLSLNGKTVIVDYAHTPDGLEKILESINQIKRRNVITVFGAGGNRDKTKRPLMGKVAKTLSNLIIITSDNPRDEDPMDIIDDILQGIEDKNGVMVIPDREIAIQKAIDIAKEGDIVLIAGKGHENYQIVKGRVLNFDDMEIAKKYIKEKSCLEEK